MTSLGPWDIILIYMFFSSVLIKYILHVFLRNKVVHQIQTLLESVSGLRAQTKFSILILKKGVKGTAAQLLTQPHSQQSTNIVNNNVLTPGKIRSDPYKEFVTFNRACHRCTKA